jgi:GTP cyclohydrolase II
MSKVDFLRHLGAQVRLTSRRWGPLTFEAARFSPAIDGDLVVYVGDPFSQERPLVRIHSECVFGEAFESTFCDCADQFRIAMLRLSQAGHGILFYLRLDGRGAGLTAKVKATALELKGYDTFDSRVAIGVEPEDRDFRPVAEFLAVKGVHSVRLLTNNPDKAAHLRSLGLDVDMERLIVTNPNRHVKKLYETKRAKFGHDIPSDAFADPQLAFTFDE